MAFYCPTCINTAQRLLVEPVRKPNSDLWECPKCKTPYDPKSWKKINTPSKAVSNSITALKRIKDEGLLSNSRLKVYEALCQHGPMTGSEINHILNSASAHKRLSELEEQGVVRVKRDRLCTVTGNEAAEWEAVDALPAAPSTVDTGHLSKSEYRQAHKALREMAKVHIASGKKLDDSLVKLGKWLAYKAE